MVWLAKLLRNDPERLLNLLMRAHRLDEERMSASRIFRAGLRIGLTHPEIARSVLESPEPEYAI